MAEASDAQGILYQNLVDAGCDDEMVQQCACLAQSGQKAEMLRLLSRHKQCLLDAVHLNQKKIDCLDHLVYKSEKEQ